MNKKLFIETIHELENHYEQNSMFSKAIGFLCSDKSIVFEGGEFATSALFKILRVLLKDEKNWIGYYCFNLQFGKKYKRYRVFSNGKSLPLKTPSDLWNLLQYNLKHK